MSRRLRPALAAALLAALALPSAVLLGSAGVGSAPASAADPTSTGSPTGTPTTGEPTPSDGPTATATVTTTVTASPSTTPDGPVAVDDAQLRWGINNESNNAAFAPGTFNLLSAGELANPGEGGKTLRSADGGATWNNGKRAGWSAKSGKVRLEKRRSDGSYTAATYAGTSTDAAGNRLTTSGRTFSDHQVVIDGGTGEVDPVAGTATVRWKGSFTVLYYSGMTFFYVADPVLSITKDRAQLLGTVSGYATDMDDMTKWVKVAGQQVVLADLPTAGLVLPGEGGFSITPAYRGVAYNAPGDGVSQVRSGDDWGAFPASFLAAMQRLGSAAYWYSSGGSADAHKVALPLTVSYSASEPVKPPVKPTPTGSADDPDDDPTQSVAPTPPTSTPTPTTPAQPAGPALPVQPAAAAPPAAAAVAAAPPTFDPRLPAIPVVTAQTAPAAARATSSGHPWEWWTGSLLLLGAAAISTVSTLSSRVKGQS